MDHRSLFPSYFLIIILFFSTLSLIAQDLPRDTTDFNENWKFRLGEIVNAGDPALDDSGWEEVSLPHDWAIAGPFSHTLPANTGKLPWKGVGWYRQHFEISSDFEGKQVYLVFDGIMAFPEIYINGQLAGTWDYGYNSFYLDVTPYLNIPGNNLVAIKADTREHDSRWYPGAGIYRKITMITTSPVHAGIWGTYVKTPVIDDTAAIIHIYTTLVNHSNNAKDVTLEGKILDPDGKDVASGQKTASIPAGGETTVDYWITLRDPERWDIGAPVLYKLEETLTDGVTLLDKTSTKFGIRTFLFTEDDGFWLNGQRMQLYGVNLHHDHGPLGAKFYPRAMQRQLEIMKAMGCNAIRTSHNVAAPELLDMCDSMGLLVFDEIFDKWDRKADYLPGGDFEEFAARNVRNFMLRDRNHPSIILWSVGNEMGDIQYDIDGGFDKLHTMVSLVRKYDVTRPVTMVCDARESARWRHFDYYDVHSWNYGRRYLPSRLLDTTRAVIISESASTLSTRGFYEFPLPEDPTEFTLSLQISSYDLNAPWWAELADQDFAWQEEDTYVCGEFVWTGFDYLGEPTPYNDEAVKEGWITAEQSSRSSYFGIVDLCGIPKDRYYLYKSRWKPEEATVHILPHWNWEGKEGDTVPVFVYTNGDQAELTLNGKSLGKRSKFPGSENILERYRLMWNDVVYEPGELKVVASKDGLVIGDAVMRTAGKPHSLKLTPDRSIIGADGYDLCYILVEAYDKNGVPCPLAENRVEFIVEGAGVLEATGNGNPQGMESFLSPARKLFFGKAMLIVRSLSGQQGEIRIAARAKGLKSDSIIIQSTNEK